MEFDAPDDDVRWFELTPRGFRLQRTPLDVSGPLPLTDIFLLATGRNERNVQAIAGEIEDKLNEAGVKTLRREGRAEGRWILLAHLFFFERLGAGGEGGEGGGEPPPPNRPPVAGSGSLSDGWRM